MVIDSGIIVASGAGLFAYATFKAVQTRRASFVAWAGASLMLLLRGITGRSEFLWVACAGIAATIALQWFEPRPMTGERLMSQLQDEIGREEHRETRRRHPK